jgi:hypothetical protein
VRHDQLPAPDQVADHALQVCFASARLGGHVLQDGGTQVKDALSFIFQQFQVFKVKSNGTISRKKFDIKSMNEWNRTKFAVNVESSELNRRSNFGFVN